MTTGTWQEKTDVVTQTDIFTGATPGLVPVGGAQGYVLDDTGTWVPPGVAVLDGTGAVITPSASSLKFEGSGVTVSEPTPDNIVVSIGAGGGGGITIDAGVPSGTAAIGSLYMDSNTGKYYEYQSVPGSDVLGAEQMSNPGFDTGSTGWTLGSNVTWVDAGGGQGHLHSAQSTNSTIVHQNQTTPTEFLTGKTYEIKFDITNYVAGRCYPRIIDTTGGSFDPAVEPVYAEANGSYTYRITIVGLDKERFQIRTPTTGGTNNFDIDNISVKEVESTGAPVNSWVEVADLQTKLITDAEGLYTANTVEGALAEIKDPGAPIVMLCIGDSIMESGFGGSGNAALQAPNTNCWFWATDQSVTTYDTGTLQLRNVDPDATAITAPADPEPFIGIKRGSYGHIAYAAADKIQKETRKQVYTLCIAHQGETSEYFLPGGGAGKEGMTALTAQVSAFLTAVGASKFDVVVYSMSTNDAINSVPPATFVTNVTSTYDHIVTQGWIDPLKVQWYQLEGTRAYLTGSRFDGLHTLLNETGQNFKVITSADLDYYNGGGGNFFIHPVPASSNVLGLRVADAALQGPNSRGYTQLDRYVDQNSPNVKADITSSKGSSLTVFGEKQAITTVAPYPVVYAAQSANDAATSGNRNGAAATYKGGDGALNQNGTGGDATLIGGTGNGTGNGGNAIVAGGAETGTGRKGYSLINNYIYGSLLAVPYSGSAETTCDTTFRKIVNGWAADGTVNGVIASESTGLLTVPVSGMYEFFFSLSVEATAAAVFRVQPAVDGAVTSPFYFYENRFKGDGTNPVNVVGLGIIALNANQTVSLWQAALSGTQSFQVRSGQFSIKRVSDIP
jgi:hypothetical protein